MKTFKQLAVWAIVTAASVATAVLPACTKDPDYSMRTDSLLRIRYEKSIDAASITGLGELAYNPVSLRQSGDTLFIANRADGADGVLVVRESTGQLIKALTSWQYQGQTETFDAQTIDVEVSSTLIFVVNRSSRIDIFNRADYSYLTTIGTSQWWTSALLQCESAVLAGNLLFVRDKHQVKAIRVEDCTAANRMKVPVYAQNTDSTSANNGFNLETIVRYDGLVYVSDFENRCILVIDPKTVQSGSSIGFVRSYRFDTKPLAMNFYKKQLFVTFADKTIRSFDPETGAEINRFTAFAGGTSWNDPGRIFFDGDRLYMTSRYPSSSWLVAGEMTYIEITHAE